MCNVSQATGAIHPSTKHPSCPIHYSTHTPMYSQVPQPTWEVPKVMVGEPFGDLPMPPANFQKVGSRVTWLHLALIQQHDVDEFPIF